MEKKIRENAIYISQLPDNVSEEQIKEHFGSIGMIKVNYQQLLWILNVASSKYVTLIKS